MTSRISHFILIAIGIFQTFTHLFWLNIAAHSGQVAIPWMMNQGKVLFGDLLEQHAPGSSALAAVAQRVLPFAPVDVARLLNVLLVLITTFLVYTLAKRLTAGDERAGIGAALAWAWWEPVYGNILLYFDTLLGFCVLIVLILWTGTEKRGVGRLFVMGLVFGAATVFKQQAWGAFVLFALWMLAYHRDWRAIAVMIAGAIIFPALTLLVIAGQGNLAEYIYWNWSFNFSGLMDGVPLTGDFFRKLLLTNIFVPAYLFTGLRFTGEKIRISSMTILLFLMWGATGIVQYPRFGEIHGMGQLPFSAVMSGIVLTYFLKSVDWRGGLRGIGQAQFINMGLLWAIAAGWLWTGLVTYIPTQIGPGKTLAYDEYAELLTDLNHLKQPGDTLFILPETDSTPQLHPLTGLLPPGTWIKGWRWYFEAPKVTETLLNEWETNPPTLVVVFPEMVESGMPGIHVFLEQIDSRYEEVDRVEDIFLHGEAIIYRLSGTQITDASP